MDQAGNAGVTLVFSSDLQCAMVESHLSDAIALHTDVSGYLIGVSIVTIPGACRGTEVEDEVDLEVFNTTLRVMAPVNAPGSVWYYIYIHLCVFFLSSSSFLLFVLFLAFGFFLSFLSQLLDKSLSTQATTVFPSISEAFCASVKSSCVSDCSFFQMPLIHLYCICLGLAASHNFPIGRPKSLCTFLPFREALCCGGCLNTNC